MKVKIFHENQKEEPTLFLTLREHNGSVTLCVVDALGRIPADWQLLSITEHGNLILHNGVARDLGLKLSGTKLAVWQP